MMDFFFMVGVHEGKTPEKTSKESRFNGKTINTKSLEDKTVSTYESEKKNKRNDAESQDLV